MKARYDFVGTVLVQGEKVNVIRDVGHATGPSVTNDAEAVVEDVIASHGGLRLFYLDSDGRLDELVHDGSKFTGFVPVSNADAYAVRARYVINGLLESLLSEDYKEGQRILLKAYPKGDKDFPDGLPEERGTIEGVAGNGMFIVRVDNKYLEDGDDGLREVHADQIQGLDEPKQ